MIKYSIYYLSDNSSIMEYLVTKYKLVNKTIDTFIFGAYNQEVEFSKFYKRCAMAKLLGLGTIAMEVMPNGMYLLLDQDHSKLRVGVLALADKLLLPENCEYLFSSNRKGIKIDNFRIINTDSTSVKFMNNTFDTRYIHKLDISNLDLRNVIYCRNMTNKRTHVVYNRNLVSEVVRRELGGE